MTTLNFKTKRQIVLDIETTGINRIGIPYEGHKIIEIGAVEMINRHITNNNFHVYLKPDRLIDQEAFRIHGISDKFLLDKPVFANVVDEFIEYILNSELIIHNASFDIGFIDYELSKLNHSVLKICSICNIIDSLALARKKFPGKRNSLDALCTRYEIDKTRRALHGALLDAQILADIYLLLTGGQTSITFNTEKDVFHKKHSGNTFHIKRQFGSLQVILANKNDLINHELILDLIQKESKGCLWRG